MKDTVEYWTFVLGYDLLHDKLKNRPCDDAFDICRTFALAFMMSDYNKQNKSGYESLKEFLKDLSINLEKGGF